MAKITKRNWKTSKGEQRTGWSLHYVDRRGKQHRKLFKLRRDAEAARIKIEAALSDGTHISGRNSISVLDAANKFLSDFQVLVDSGRRERSTLRSYQQHIEAHMQTYPIAGKKLSDLQGPDCIEYARALEMALSDATARKVFGTFRRIMDFAVGHGWIASNLAKSVSIRTSGTRSTDNKIAFPSKDQLRGLIAAARRFDNTGRCHAMIGLLMFCGLRASELRGLRWADIDLVAQRVSITQRADRWQQIGPVKTGNSRRTVPIPSSAATALRTWKLASQPLETGLVFPTGTGRPENYGNIYSRVWRPLMKAANLAHVSTVGDVEKVKVFFGLHMLRHVACSLWIEQGADAQRVKAWAGHANIQFTFDTYGHLWQDNTSDQAIALAIEKSIGA